MNSQTSNALSSHISFFLPFSSRPTDAKSAVESIMDDSPFHDSWKFSIGLGPDDWKIDCLDRPLLEAHQGPVVRVRIVAPVVSGFSSSDYLIGMRLYLSEIIFGNDSPFLDIDLNAG